MQMCKGLVMPRLLVQQPGGDEMKGGRLAMEGGGRASTRSMSPSACSSTATRGQPRKQHRQPRRLVAACKDAWTICHASSVCRAASSTRQ